MANEIDLGAVAKGAVLKVVDEVDASSRADFAVLKAQRLIHRKLRFTAKRVGRDKLEVLDDSKAFRHNFAEHEKARQSMALRRLLMESIDTSMLTAAELAEYREFLRAQTRDLQAIIKVRTQEALDAKRDRGERIGTVPFGYRVAADGVQLEMDEAEQGILAKIRELRASGLTTRKIADELNRQGVTNRRGSGWRFEYVVRALRAMRGAL